MRYKARYTFEGDRGRMNYLRPGDLLVLEDGRTATILWVVQRDDGTVYDTDGMGIVYARELERIG